jgi:tRNA 2-selenouridine synthase
MPLTKISAADALAQLDTFSTIIDARSESEYALDRLPGAVNWPTLDDDERRIVGTEYKQVSAFDARKRGAVMAARNIATHIEAHTADKPKNWKPLTYCWRGGQRSGSLSLVLSQIGFDVHIIDGGYKAFRAEMLLDTARLASTFTYRVICGPTGSGKTRLLTSLAAAGAQVLDLEALAEHRSSVLGLIPGQPQPSQKQFDTRIWNALHRFDPARVVWAESESKKVGNVSVPDALMTALRESACARLELPVEERVKLLMEDYAFFVKDPDFFCKRLDVLKDLRGKAVIENWKTRVHSGHVEDVVRELLELHYDPGYATSTQRNYRQFEAGYVITALHRSDLNDTAFAQNILTATASN